MGFSLWWLLLLWSIGTWASVVVAHGPSCSATCGIFLDQGSNLCPLHWQADSYPLCHQGRPQYCFNHDFPFISQISFPIPSLSVFHIYSKLAFAFLVAQLVKNLPTMWETWVRSLDWEGKGYPLQYSGLENSTGSQRVRHNWLTFTFTFKLSTIEHRCLSLHFETETRIKSIII